MGIFLMSWFHSLIFFVLSITFCECLPLPSLDQQIMKGLQDVSEISMHKDHTEHKMEKEDPEIDELETAIDEGDRDDYRKLLIEYLNKLPDDTWLPVDDLGLQLADSPDSDDDLEKGTFAHLSSNLLDKRIFDRLSSNLPDKRSFDRLSANLPDKRGFDNLSLNIPDKRNFDRLSANLLDKRRFDSLSANLPDKRGFDKLSSNLLDKRFSGSLNQRMMAEANNLFNGRLSHLISFLANNLHKPEIWNNLRE